MREGDWPMDKRRLRRTGCTQDEILDLLGERAPHVQGDDELARYVQTLLVALSQDDDEMLAWVLLMGPPSWMSEPKETALPSRGFKLDESPRMEREWKQVKRAMSKPPKMRIPGPAYPPPLTLPEPQE